MIAELDIPDVDDASHMWTACRAFRPRPVVRLIDWSAANMRNEFDVAFDERTYPHHGAPGGPMDAFDDPNIRDISLQWATRLGKSFFAECALLKTADVDPAPMMHANSTETLALQVTERIYKAARKNERIIKKLLKPLREQKQDLVEFRECQMFVAWSRSATTLADKSIKVGHGGEWDKWEHTGTSKEAHPHELFVDRFKDFWQVRKVIHEGTPTIRDRSPIEAKRLAGTNCSFQVPCAECQRYQLLEMGDAKTWGVRWESDGGRSNPDLALRTGWYQCRFCSGRNEDHHRSWQMNRGVWVPEGCTVNDKVALEITDRAFHKGQRHEWTGWKNARWIKGTPTRDGISASYQLSSLYALKLGWGDVAKAFVGCKDKPQKLRNFVNQWLAQTWVIRKSVSTAELLAQRIGGSFNRGIVPLGATFVIVAADRQASDGEFVKFVVLAGGPEERVWLVDYGIVPTLEALWDQYIRKAYVHADGGPPLTPLGAIIDSGFKTQQTYDFVNAHPGCLACKGSSSDLGGAPYRLGRLGSGTRTGAVGQALLEVGTDFWETSLQDRLDVKLAEQPGSLTVCADAARDFDFLEELLNAAMDDVVDKRGNKKLLWVKLREHDPNDYRDATRYGLCLIRALIDDRGGRVPPRVQVAAERPPPSAKDSSQYRQLKRRGSPLRRRGAT